MFSYIYIYIEPPIFGLFIVRYVRTYGYTAVETCPAVSSVLERILWSYVAASTARIDVFSGTRSARDTTVLLALCVPGIFVFSHVAVPGGFGEAGGILLGLILTTSMTEQQGAH